MCESILQGISNIMQKYPGHNINHFFGNNPMTSAQFFVLCAQIKYEYEQEQKEMKKANKGRKK